MISNKLGGAAASRPELVAYHWTNAGELDLAIAAWHKAGDFATARIAFKEAEQAYQNALGVLIQLPASPERDDRELTLQSLLAGALRITRGLSAPETRNATARARALADRKGNRAEQLLQSWERGRLLRAVATMRPASTSRISSIGSRSPTGSRKTSQAPT